MKKDPRHFDFKIKLSTGTWYVYGNALDGLSNTKQTIWVSSELSDKRHLEISIHETLHASKWKLSEDEVTTAAEDIAEVLWRIGYRLPRGKR